MSVNLVNGPFIHGHVMFSSLLSDLGTFTQEQLQELHCEEAVTSLADIQDMPYLEYALLWNEYLMM